jgi:hypothetical protein
LFVGEEETTFETSYPVTKAWKQNKIRRFDWSMCRRYFALCVCRKSCKEMFILQHSGVAANAESTTVRRVLALDCLLEDLKNILSSGGKIAKL